MVPIAFALGVDGLGKRVRVDSARVRRAHRLLEPRLLDHGLLKLLRVAIAGLLGIHIGILALSLGRLGAVAALMLGVRGFVRVRHGELLVRAQRLLGSLTRRSGGQGGENEGEGGRGWRNT